MSLAFVPISDVKKKKKFDELMLENVFIEHEELLLPLNFHYYFTLKIHGLEDQQEVIYVARQCSVWHYVTDL